MTLTPKSKAEETAPSPTCGVIMPISATASRTEAQWTDVQKLLHRAIRLADFDPQNVWEVATTDRISERIISSIFRHPIAVADITDLNPNVMLELGLRLASKKPTIVVVSKGAAIPFDIRDFHAVDYPADTNMLGMEDFFARISIQLKEKYKAFKSDKYKPFLSSVVIDVLAPKEREGTLNEVVLSRLDALAYKLQRIENLNVTPKPRRSPGLATSYWNNSEIGIYITCHELSNVSKLGSTMKAIPGYKRTRLLGNIGSISYLALVFDAVADDDARKLLQEQVQEMIASFSSDVGISSDILDNLESRLRER